MTATKYRTDYSLKTALSGAGLEKGQVSAVHTLETLELEILRSYIAKAGIMPALNHAMKLPAHRVESFFDSNEGVLPSIHHLTLLVPEYSE